VGRKDKAEGEEDEVIGVKSVMRILQEEDDAGDLVDSDPENDPVTVDPRVVYLISDKHEGTYVRIKYAASNNAAPKVGNEVHNC